MPYVTPKYLILDEPLNALDTKTTISLRKHIENARKMQQTVFISSHVLSFIDELADEILFLDHGKLKTVAQNAAGKAESIYQRIFC